MSRVVRSELLKLRRPAVLYGVGAVLPLLSVVATLAVVLAAGDGPTDGPGVTRAALSGSGGLTAGFAATASFLGILVFALFATSTGGEHTGGTLRALLTREPRRLRLLGGKLVALSLFTAAALLVAVVGSAVTALLLAPSQDLATSGWLDGAGLRAAAGDYGDALLAALLYGLLGAAVATLARSGTIALGAGLAWLLPAEHIVQNAWAGAGRWFPGLLLEGLAAGGNDTTTYARAVLLGGGTAVAAALVAAGVFARRDVST